MRPLNTETFTLSEFFGENIPPYAILSHRWEAEEVTFRDLNDGNDPGLAGFSKILGLCTQARKDSLDWAWIDTCCIDKSSSAELSEAINSMFKWYRNAHVCYAYLSDVVEDSESFETRKNQSFSSSKWFTRGWTLQELLAPKKVQFFNCAWKYKGSRDGSRRHLLSKITGIENFDGFRYASIAQKMSWMANRQTTRIEDTAYCMLGLFGVYMPLIYGEGARAFRRLQLELLRISEDDSLLAWSFNGQNKIPATTGPFAASPAYFRYSGNIVRSSYNPYRRPLSMTSKGLLFERYLNYSPKAGESVAIISVILNCRKSGFDRPIVIKLVLERRGDIDEYERIPDVGGCRQGSKWPYARGTKNQWSVLLGRIALSFQTQHKTFYLRDP
jgi:hypothetical protein